ncbi:MBL fold metallo-hydrolase [Enterococcus alishanensis]
MKQSIFKNLRQITFMAIIFPVNCYVYETKNSLIVIDMGMKGFVKEIEEIKRATNKPVEMLLLTHAHGDHINGIPQFKKSFPEVPIGISKRDYRLLKGDFSLDTDEMPGKIKGGYPKVEMPIDFTFDDGEQLADILVIVTPGHTPGSVTFLTPEGFAIAGDAFQSRGRLAVSGDRVNSFPFPAFATWSKETALNSAKKFQHLDLQLLAVGHGDMLENPDKAIEQAVKEFEVKINGKKN